MLTLRPSDLPAAPDRERLAGWNAAYSACPPGACTHELVAAQAVATPDATAVVAGGRELSYRELNERANRLARLLSAMGVGPDVLVACRLERSVELAVVLLAVLKAGGAYLPLDPTYPADRLRFMLEDSAASVLITPEFLEAEARALAAESAKNPVSSASVGDLAYVIYTSGSTGRPKGVQITHRNLLNLIQWHRRAFEINAADRASQVTSPAFDATGWELWPYLTVGASVHFAPEEARTDPPAMRDWLLAREITVSFLPTPVAERVMALDWPRIAPLRLLLTGADTLHSYPAATLPFTVVNNYGPTETTVVATSGVVPPLGDRGNPPSIGMPIANTQVHILDEALRPVPSGAVGEIFIGGVGVGRGYLNRPELTGQRFVADPFAREPGALMYRTGDLARYLENGEIAFLGRADHQVKIRGFRVEPDEAASVLSRHPGIQTCTVIGREDVPGETRLVAYVTLAAGASPTLQAMQETLAAQLPDYMIPSVFVVLDELPLTPNGKVDRAALPAPDGDNVLREHPAAAPLTATEAHLAGVVASLLRLERVSIDDNFFLLGGNSLMGAQLIARIKDLFGISLPLRTLFESPTVRKLALEVEFSVVAAVDSMSENEVLQLLAQDA